MLNHSTENWSLCIGRWREVEVRLHILLPLLALFVLMTDVVTPRIAIRAIAILISSVVLHELVRVFAASRVGGHTRAIVLGPIGGFTKLHLPVDPTAHLITGLVGPVTFFVLMVAAGCGLALAEDHDMYRLLLYPTDPIKTLDLGSPMKVVGQLVVWINWCLLIVALLPIDPSAGAELLRGVLWPVVGRSTATSATSHVALGAAVFAALLALIVQQQSGSADLLPTALVPGWFPLAAASVFLLYGGSRSALARRYDVGLAIDEFDSDDEEWLAEEYMDEDREAVLVEHLQDKQQEALDRKRREREANEDARVDAILARLRHSTFDQLSEEDRTILKRASRRYRRRRDTTSEGR